MTVSSSEGFPSQSMRIRAVDLGVLPAPSLGVGWGPLHPLRAQALPCLGTTTSSCISPQDRSGTSCSFRAGSATSGDGLLIRPDSWFQSLLAGLLVNLPDAASPGPTLQDSVQNRWLDTSLSQSETLFSRRETPTIVCGQEPGLGTCLSSRPHTLLYKKFPQSYDFWVFYSKLESFLMSVPFLTSDSFLSWKCPDGSKWFTLALGLSILFWVLFDVLWCFYREIHQYSW